MIPLNITEWEGKLVYEIETNVGSADVIIRASQTHNQSDLFVSEGELIDRFEVDVSSIVSGSFNTQREWVKFRFGSGVQGFGARLDVKLY